MKIVGILLFDDAEELDFVGPLEVFGTAARLGADCEILIVAENATPIRARNGLKIVPTCTFERAPLLSILIVPGGLGARTHARQNQHILEFVRAQKGLVASVCTGALILAEAGLLTGLAATTHHSAFDVLEQYPGVSVRRGERWIIGERIATSAGVSAGIDLALALVASWWGAGIAEKVAENLEWNSTAWNHRGKAL
jgi:transcriptional regulator GlxA family with amidase domain